MSIRWQRRLVLLAVAICTTTSTSLAGEATLYRDTWGVPHIWAEDYASAGYAVGQAQCEDSALNVIYCLHAGVGRLSEIFGPHMLPPDREARKFRHAVYAEADWPRLSKPVQQLLLGYCAGVNDFLETHAAEIPVQVEPVGPVQVIAWHRALLMMSAIGIARADAEASKADGYHPAYNPDQLGAPVDTVPKAGQPAHPGVPPGKSNSWALSGAKTEAGVPMLLIDPHWPSEGHLQLYELWLHIADELHVGGFCLTGTPLPGLGATPHLAWTVTAGGADSADAYALRINPDNPHQYEFDGQWEAMDVRTETVRARESDGAFSEHTFDVMETRHGPVLETQGGALFAAAMGGYKQADCLEQYFRMVTATTTDEWRQAIAMNRLSFFNLMWATTEGDIGYVQTGQAPLRPVGPNWTKLVPGWTSQTLYERDLALSEHPTVENPFSGFLQNCNVAANVVTPGQTMTSEDYPPGVLYGHYAQYRARGSRATRLLTEVSQATLEDGRRIAFDAYVPPADLWIPVILEGYDEWIATTPAAEAISPEDDRLREAARLLGTWNRYATRDSIGATVFRFWRLECHKLETPAGRDQFDIPNTAEVRADAVQALRLAANRLHEMYGRIDVPWGDIKRLRRGDREWPLSGDGLGKRGMDTLRATTIDEFNEEGKLISSGGQCVTSIVLLTSPPTIRAVVAYGQSNDPNSPHFDDQAPLYSEERFREVSWTMEQLQPVVETQTTFNHEP